MEIKKDNLNERVERHFTFKSEENHEDFYTNENIIFDKFLFENQERLENLFLEEENSCYSTDDFDSIINDERIKSRFSLKNLTCETPQFNYTKNQINCPIKFQDKIDVLATNDIVSIQNFKNKIKQKVRY